VGYEERELRGEHEERKGEKFLKLGWMGK